MAPGSSSCMSTAPRRTCSARRSSSRPGWLRRIRAAVEALDPRERELMLSELAGERRNRRHRPGRGWEAVRYRFEIVSDYGGFRDLQRHRLLTCQWQRLSPDLGAGVPDEVRQAGVGDEYERALEISRREFARCLESAACRTPPRTRSASATGFATSSTSMRARRCTSASFARAGRVTHVSRGRAGHVRADRRRPRDRPSDAPRRHVARTAPGAHPERDPHAPQAPARAAS